MVCLRTCDMIMTERIRWWSYCNLSASVGGILFADWDMHGFGTQVVAGMLWTKCFRARVIIANKLVVKILAALS